MLTKKRNLEIIRLRNLANWQASQYAEWFYRRAAHPIYPGQEAVCLSKAAQAERLASENYAKADLLEAEGGLDGSDSADYPATGDYPLC